MSPKASLDASYSFRAAEIVRSLDGVSDADDAEAALLNHGDDILDVVIGWRETARNRWLLGCKPIPRGCWNGDVIAIGSGPSLDAALPRLRELQESVVLVAAHSAIGKLLANGIVPHVITPKERDPPCGLVPKDMPASVIYGGLACVPEAPERCHRHWLVTNIDHFLRWLGHGGGIHQPLTSGTLAACVGAYIGNAVYLVGHDLSIGHFDGYALTEETQGGSIACVDGVTRPSCLLYRRARDELSSLAEDAVIVQCAPTGGKITGRLALHGDLPKFGHRPVSLPTYDRVDEAAIGDAEAKIARLPAIMAAAEHRARNARDAGDLSARALFGDDELLGGALFQSVYLSTSILRRTLRLTDAECTDAMRDAILSALDGLRGTWKEMADDCAR